MKSTTTLRALGNGLVGAVVLTAVHETARQLIPETAPRMDVLGMRGLRKLLGKANAPQPDHNTLFTLTMAGDLLSNGLYYSLVGTGKSAWQRAAVLGLAAGVGGVLLPGSMGLGEGPSNRTTPTRLMTVAWYLLGGLATAGAARMGNK